MWDVSSPCHSDTPGPTGQYVADHPVGPYVTRGPVGSYGTSSPCDSDTPDLVTPMRIFPQSHQDGGECMDMHGGWSGVNVAGTPTAVAMVDLRAGYPVSNVGRIREDPEDVARRERVDDYNFDLLEGM